MSRPQLQDSEVAALPDKAMLATVLSYLKNKNLKETAEVLQKELSTQAGDTSRPMQFPSGVQSGTEPMKYEESYTSQAPSPSPTSTTTAAYLKLASGNTHVTTSHQEASQQTTVALPSVVKVPSSSSPSQSDNSDQVLINDAKTSETIQDDDEERYSRGVASPHNHDKVSSTSSTPPPAAVSPVKDATKMLKFQPVPFFMPASANAAATATTTTQTVDKNPLWNSNKNASPSSISNGLAAKGLQSVFFPSSISGATPLSLAGADVEGSGLILKSPPTRGPPPLQSVASVIARSPPGAVRPQPSLMYQLMTPPTNCVPHPLLGGVNTVGSNGTVLTVLPSPPTTTLTVNPQSVFLVANQNLAAGNSLQVGKPLDGKDLIAKHGKDDKLVGDSMEPATGQAQYPSNVSSTTANTVTSPPPHPRTLASIPPSELTPQHLELKAFAEDFKTRRIRLGFTQGAVGTSLAERGYNNFAQSTISRFEQMQLSPANAATIRVILEKWLLEAESPDSVPSNQSGDLPIMAGRKRKKRAVFTPQTKSTLDEFFAQNPRPNRQAIEGISQQLDLLPEEVRVWFCNKRQKSKSGSVSTSCDRESSSATSSGVPSPTISEGGLSQKRRSPSPPKTPFTIEELSKSSSNGTTGLISSPVHLSTSSILPLGGLVASVTQSMNQPLIFAPGGASSPPVVFRGAGNKSPPMLLPSNFLAANPIITEPSFN